MLNSILDLETREADSEIAHPAPLPCVCARSYTVFSLGNSTYEHYQAMGRLVDKVLNKMGASRVFQRGEGDDDKR